MDKFPSIEKLAALFDGNLPEDEMQQITRLAANNEAIHDILDANTTIDNALAFFDEQDMQLSNEIVGMNFELPEIDHGDNLTSIVLDLNEDGGYYQKYDFTENNQQTHKSMAYKQTIGDVVPFNNPTEMEVKQIHDDTCAIKSQQIVLTAFGQDISEDQLVREAIQRGVYVPGCGTSPEDVGVLLNAHGVSTHTVHHAHVYDLVSELAQGHKVIVGVDSGELWEPSFAEKFEDLLSEKADHALVVTGIDTTDPDNVKVIITDPGTGDVAKSYPLDQFIDAWSDSQCQLVATDDAPPAQFDHGMFNFDYSLGYIPFINDMPYEFFNQVYLPTIDNFFMDSFSHGISGEIAFSHALAAFDSFDGDGIDTSLLDLNI